MFFVVLWWVWSWRRSRNARKSGEKEIDGRQSRDLGCCGTGESRGRKRPISDDHPSLPPLCGASYRGRSRVGIIFWQSTRVQKPTWDHLMASPRVFVCEIFQNISHTLTSRLQSSQKEPVLSVSPSWAELPFEADL